MCSRHLHSYLYKWGSHCASSVLSVEVVVKFEAGVVKAEGDEDRMVETDMLRESIWSLFSKCSSS